MFHFQLAFFRECAALYLVATETLYHFPMVPKLVIIDSLLRPDGCFFHHQSQHVIFDCPTSDSIVFRVAVRFTLAILVRLLLVFIFFVHLGQFQFFLLRVRDFGKHVVRYLPGELSAIPRDHPTQNPHAELKCRDDVKDGNVQVGRTRDGTMAFWSDQDQTDGNGQDGGRTGPADKLRIEIGSTANVFAQTTPVQERRDDHPRHDAAVHVQARVKTVVESLQANGRHDENDRSVFLKDEDSWVLAVIAFSLLSPPLTISCYSSPCSYDAIDKRRPSRKNKDETASANRV
jgi:hypothetical protein